MLTHALYRTTSTALLAMLLAAATLLATLSALAAEPPASDNGNSACRVQVAAIHTEFPQALQTRGAHGVVALKVAIDKDGRANTTQVTQSSGYASLDRTAANSVNQSWRFDVSRCAATEFPIEAVVKVQFQRAPQDTVSGTVDRHRADRIKKDLASNRCDVTQDNSGDAVIACVAETSPVNRNVETSLANRIDTNLDAKHRE